MGSVSLKISDGSARFKRASLCSSALINTLMIFSVIITNLFALYAFTSSPHTHTHTHLPLHKNFSLISEQVTLILREINSSQNKLAQIQKHLLGYQSLDLSRPNIPSELKLFLHHHHLPLGKDSKTGITQMVSSIGHTCHKSSHLLSHYMTYNVSKPCPDDWSIAQKLILRGCEPLPRRRCFAKTISKANLLHPFPTSLWKPRFVRSRSKSDFVVDQVLALGSGGVRIGLDVGGGSGSFAAVMAERNVTVVTITLNVDAPFSEFIAARGLFPLFLSLDHRLPFFDNVFDLVRCGSGLDGGGSPEKLEFLMFDVDRVLRAGGLFWMDNLCYVDEEKKRVLTRLIERFGYKKLKWVVGDKSVGSAKSHVVLSAVLQKPVRV
uniref:Methyltransferase type 11 domain-containing protein n=1 Tax=Cajanus cajan TaxID=3821 RepID=A0A151TKR2_CAJCA|nr:hypothetical protein KK1_023988 [Cajanus cajan]